MEIKVLGTGCSKCVQLEENVRTAVNELGIDANIEKVTDIKEIIAYGVMQTPALVVDGEVKVAGKVLKPDKIKKYLG